MSGLEGQHWTEVPVPHVHLAFLRAEADRLDPALRDRAHALVMAPSLSSQDENLTRQELLYSRRGRLFADVPNATTWHEVRYLESRHLDMLLVIGRCGWDDPGDQNASGVPRRYRGTS